MLKSISIDPSPLKNFLLKNHHWKHDNHSDYQEDCIVGHDSGLDIAQKAAEQPNQTGHSIDQSVNNLHIKYGQNTIGKPDHRLDNATPIDLIKAVLLLPDPIHATDTVSKLEITLFLLITAIESPGKVDGSGCHNNSEQHQHPLQRTAHNNGEISCNRREPLVEQIHVGRLTGKRLDHKIRNTQESTEDGSNGQDPEGYRHHSGTLMQILCSACSLFELLRQLECTVEGGEGEPEHVEGGQKCRYHTDAPEHKIECTGIVSIPHAEGVHQHFIFGEETGQWRNTGNGDRSDQKRFIGRGHVLSESAHESDVLSIEVDLFTLLTQAALHMLHSVDHRA